MEAIDEKRAFTSRVLYTRQFEWRKFEFVQQDDFKELPLEARQKLKASIIANNFTQPFYAWRDPETSIVYCLDGKHRTSILEELTAESYDIPRKLPTTFIDCKDKREAARLVLLYSSIYAKITSDGLLEFSALYDLSFDELQIQMDIPGLELPEVFGVLPTVELEDNFIVPESIETDFVIGDLFEIGSHRLLCGDAKDANDVARLLGGKEPYLMVTDPPYGVEYDPTWRHRAGINSSARTGKVENDDNADWSEVWLLSPSRVAYIWHGGKYTSTVQRSLEASGFEVRSQIIWNKQQMVFSRGNYHWKHEPCWYAVKKGSKGNWVGDRTQTTVWDIQSILQASKTSTDDAAQIHGTQKPVECMARPLRNHDGDVYDPFLGSGTTMVAAHRLNRSCYAMEIDPKNCQMTVDRLKALDPGVTVKRNGKLL